MKAKMAAVSEEHRPSNSMLWSAPLTSSASYDIHVAVTTLLEYLDLTVVNYKEVKQ